MTKKPMINDVKLTVRIPNDLRDKLNEHSKEKNIKASELIRRLIIKEIETLEK